MKLRIYDMQHYIYLGQWFPKSAPRTTGGPRDFPRWSANPNINQYFVLRGPPNFCKWSANQKSLGTTDLGSSTGLGNVRPTGHIQPTKHLNVAHEIYLKFHK